MSEDDKLTPADPREVVNRAPSRPHSEASAGAVSGGIDNGEDRRRALVEHLDRSGFVIMRKPIPASGAGDIRADEDLSFSLYNKQYMIYSEKLYIFDRPVNCRTMAGWRYRGC
jgi:hypothetical protein